MWNKYHFRRGDICVIRREFGHDVIMKIHHQHHYKEWSGCFSLI